MAEFEMSMKLVDAYGRDASKRFTLVAAVFADALTLAGNFVADVAGATGLRILSYTLSQEVVYSDVVTAGSNRDAGLSVSVRKADNDKATIKLPGPIATMFNSDGTLDLTNVLFTAFISEFLAGNVLVSDGEVVTEVISGRLDD